MNPQPFDSLSASVRRLLDAARVDGAYEQLVVRPQQTQQQQQQQNFPDRALLERLSAEELFDATVTRHDEARCVLAGLWLYLDELDRAHRIVQDVASPSGSFWHAIVHRREGDFANSRYWYARCREHPVLGAPPAEVAGPALVDLVEQAVDRRCDDPARRRAIRAQRLEWDSLFAHCARAATTAAGMGTAAGGAR
jgi:hypothetical protein